MATTAEEILKRFTYHPPQGDQALRYQDIRDRALIFAGAIINLTPESREQTLALDALDEVVMFANAAIARNEV